MTLSKLSNLGPSLTSRATAPAPWVGSPGVLRGYLAISVEQTMLDRPLLRRVSRTNASEFVLNPRRFLERTFAKLLFQHSVNIGCDRFGFINPCLGGDIDPSDVGGRKIVPLD